jgi:hypothetical protein
VTPSGPPAKTPGATPPRAMFEPQQGPPRSGAFALSASTIEPAWISGGAVDCVLAGRSSAGTAPQVVNARSTRLASRRSISARECHPARSLWRLPCAASDRRARMMRLAPVASLWARLKLHRLNVRPSDDEVALDYSHGERGQRPALPHSSSASRFTAGAPGFLNFNQSGEPDR